MRSIYLVALFPLSALAALNGHVSNFPFGPSMDLLAWVVESMSDPKTRSFILSFEESHMLTSYSARKQNSSNTSYSITDSLCIVAPQQANTKAKASASQQPHAVTTAAPTFPADAPMIQVLLGAA